MSRIESMSASDPTIEVTYMTLQPTFLRWWIILNVPREDAATATGMNAWFLENKVTPLATRLGKERVRKLIQAVAESHKAVCVNAVSPWTVLTAGILRAMM
jgi:hypothetical protein